MYGHRGKQILTVQEKFEYIKVGMAVRVSNFEGIVRELPPSDGNTKYKHMYVKLHVYTGTVIYRNI
jgi:hypothetical protein